MNNYFKAFLLVALTVVVSAPIAFADHGDEATQEHYATTVKSVDTHMTSKMTIAKSAASGSQEQKIALLQKLIALLTEKQQMDKGMHSDDRLHTDSEHTDGHSHNETVEHEAEVSLEVKKGMSGYNLHVTTKNFTFAPEHADGVHVKGEGHAHIMIDGKKAGRMYSPWHYLMSLGEKGTHTISVALATNDHKAYVHKGKPVEGSVTVVVE